MWWVNSSSCWAQQQLHFTLLSASGPAAPGVICTDSGCMATAPGDMFMRVSISIKAPRSSLIYVCIKAPKMYSISRVPVQQQRDAVQLQKHLPAGTWNDILGTKNYGILKLELKRFLFLWGLLVWQVANRVLYNVFCLSCSGALRIACTFSLNEWQVLE